MANEPEQPATQPGLPATQAEQVPSLPTEQWSPPTEPWSPGGPPPPSRRGIPRWLLAVGAVTAVLSVISFFTALFWPSNPAQPLDFHAFESTGTVDASDVDRVRVDAERAYFAAELPGEVAMVASDFSGAVAWEATVNLESLRNLSYAGDAVLVHGDTAFESPPGRVVALDASNGDELWQRFFDIDSGGWRVFQDMIIFWDEDELVGVDPGTGDQAWDLPVPADAVFTAVPVVTEADLAGVSRRGDTLDVPRQGDRVVIVAGDGSTRVIDINTGNLLSEGSAVASTSSQADRAFAFGDDLFLAEGDSGRLYRFDLNALDGNPEILYTAPGGEWSPMEVVTCGPQRVCVLVDGEEEPELLAVNTGGGREWDHPVPDADWLLPVGEEIVVVTSEPGVMAFDRGGNEIFSRAGEPVRLNAGNVLLFAGTPGSTLDDLSAAGVALQAGSADRNELGQLRGVRGAGCAWNEQHLACPTGDGGEIWRFAD